MLETLIHALTAPTRRSQISKSFLSLLVLALTATPALQADNLVDNGDFSKFENGKPVGWRKPDSSPADLSYVTDDKPEGAAGSLKVKITGAHSGQGQIIQKFKIPQDGAYYMQTWVKSNGSEDGFVQIKLYKGGKEFNRISVREPGNGWQKVGKEFETHGATEMAVLLRYKQNKSNVGNTLSFADVTVIPAAERVRETPQISKLEAVPTFNSIGVYADISGDMSKFTKGHMVFRKKGESEWRPTIGVVWHSETKQMRGSLLNLEEDAEYEVKVWMTDDTLKEEMPAATTSIKTWSSEVPIGRTIHLGPGRITEPMTITEKGSPNAWIRITGSPEGHTVIDTGYEENNAIVIVDSQYIVIDNLTIKGGLTDAIRISDSSDIRIRRCNISQWGQTGTLTHDYPNKKWGRGPLYLDANGERINLDAGVRINPGATRVVVEDCFIHAPVGRASHWGAGHPLGPTSIIMANSDGNHVIRNNDLVGGQDHRWNDTIEAAWNNKVKGGPYRDTDIQGNIMLFSNDDGIELDGGQMNVRMFNNWIQSSYCGISTAPTIYGPSYLFRNLIVLDGEERGHTNFAFKIGGNRVNEPGMNYIFHNTVYSNSKGLRGGNWGRGPTPVQTRNNLFGLGEILYPQKSLGDFDYDMLREGSMDPDLDIWQQNGVTGVEKFQNRNAGDYRLSDGSPALNQGVKIPMVNDEHHGSAPDIGAFPANADPLFPIRKNSPSLLPLMAHVEMTLGEGPTQEAKLTLVAPASSGERWRAIADAPWIKVTPEVGPCDGKPQELTVTFSPQDAREGLNLGAVTIRTDAGYNRTSVIKGYARIKDAIVREANAVDLEHSGFTVIEPKDAPVPKVLQAPKSRDESAGSSIKFPVTIDQSGVYYLHALTYLPGPGAPGRDSFRLQVDDGEIEYWSFGKSAPSNWTWQTADISKKAYPYKIELTPGEHVITIWGRESLTEVAKFALSKSSLPPKS